MASVRSAVSVNITPPVATPAQSRSRKRRWSMRMTITKVNFFYGTKQVLFDIS